MRHKIFLVHGMGVYDGDTWAAEVKEVLVQAYANYPRLAAIDFDARFEIQMIHYDPIFQEIVTRWQTDAEALAPLGEELEPDINSLVGWLRGAGKKDGNFIWSHAADVLLYRLSALVRERVKVHVAKQIVEGVSRQYEEHKKSLWSVIAHSLGTIATHDALDMLATGKVPDTPVNAFDPRIEQAQVIAMVANVSRLLETVVDVYDSTVKPGRAGQSGRNCLRFLNPRHFLDPFTIPQMFHPQAWPDAETVAALRYRYIEVSHVHQANVHDICHYLKNPQVHIPLFQSLAGDSKISKTEAKAAIDSFPQLGSFQADHVAKIKKDLAEASPSMGERWRAIGQVWDRFQSILQTRGEA